MWDATLQANVRICSVFIKLKQTKELCHHSVAQHSVFPEFSMPAISLSCRFMIVKEPECFNQWNKPDFLVYLIDPRRVTDVDQV